jgi:GcrA cell cycle regulator
VSAHCAWPEGEPGAPDFSFCGAPVAHAGDPYCERHAAIAYRRDPEALEAAAQEPVPRSAR